MVTIRGELIILKALQREDCLSLWDATEIDVDHPTEMYNPGLARVNADKWFDEMQEKQGKSGIDPGVFEPQGRVVGNIQITGIDWQNRAGNMGLGFAKPADRGKGYGTDAMRLLLRYGFANLGLHRLAANTLAFNEAARKLLTRCGFQEEGTNRDAFYHDGAWFDRIQYGLLEHEHRAQAE